MIEWSYKQWMAYMMAEHPASTILLDGAARGGKTMPATHGFCRKACKQFAGHDFIVASRSQRQLSGVILKYMREFARAHGMSLRRHEDHYRLNSWIGGPPNRFWPLIGSDVASADKAAGFTAAGALLDEGLKQPYEFVQVVRERCISVPGSVVALVTNTGPPSHWIHEEMIEGLEDDDSFLRINFRLEDNETLTRAQIDHAYSLYPPGPMRDRRIGGLWVAAEGQVYPHFDRAVRPPPEDELPYRYAIVADGAKSGVTHAILFAFYRSGIWAIKEWRHDGRQQGEMPVEVQARKIVQHLAGDLNVADWGADPAAADLRFELSKASGRTVVACRNDVELGIQKTTQWLYSGGLNICPTLRHTIREFHGYVWDPLAARRGEDKPLKKDDHSPDVVRYFTLTLAGTRARRRSQPRVVTLATAS